MQMSPCQYLRWAEREVRRNLILGPCLPSPCQHRNAPDQLRYPPRAALVSLPPQREPRCEAVRSPLSPRSQVLTFLHSPASSEANPEKMFSACFSAPPRLRVKQHLSNSTRSRPGRNRRRLALSARLRTAVPRRISKACSANRRERNFRAILRAMRVCPPEYQHLHSRSPKHFRAILINTRKAIAQIGRAHVWNSSHLGISYA